MAEALVNPSVLLWARARAKMEPDTLAEKANVKTDRLLLWEEGTTRPTFKQAQDLARALHIPFGFLFLSSPPIETLPIPDLRTVKNRVAGWLSPDLRDVLADVLRKQSWYRDYRLERGAGSLPFVGRFDLGATEADIATSVAGTLGLTAASREQASNWEEYLDLLMKKAEHAGVSVMRSGVVGSNTHRVLDVNEFRGFAICDQIAPVVFINGRDAKAAQIFTLVHELAHLWVGRSGISDLSISQPPDTAHDRTERVCNAVAAEVLVPAEPLRHLWKEDAPVAENAARLSIHFRVSAVVIARRACDLRLINWTSYAEFYQQQTEIWRKLKENEGGRGNYYLTLPVKNGRGFTSAVLQSALEHNLLLRDAGRLLGISPAKIGRLAEKTGIR